MTQRDILFSCYTVFQLPTLCLMFQYNPTVTCNLTCWACQQITGLNQNILLLLPLLLLNLLQLLSNETSFEKALY